MAARELWSSRPLALSGSPAGDGFQWSQPGPCSLRRGSDCVRQAALQRRLIVVESENDPLLERRRKARALIRTHDAESMVSEAILCLREAHAGGVDVMRKYQPWNVLLGIKWILQEADAGSYLRLPASRNDVHGLLNLLHEMEALVRMPSEYTNVHLFMRHLAFQQFWLQHHADGAAIARQDLLFTSLPEQHTLQRRFHDLTGLRIAEFLELSYATVALVLDGNPGRAFKAQNFDNLAPRLSEGAVDRFLACLSKTAPEFHAWLAAPPHNGADVAAERILRTPLIDAPLLNVKGTFVPFYIPLLLRTLESGVYRILRAADRADFAMRFGHLFERHVGLCLESARVAFHDERQLRTVFGDRPRCIDFMIVEDDCTVLIDAKAVEMSEKGRVSHRPEVVLSALRDSALKGVSQGMATMQELRQLTRSAPFVIGRKAAFLLIVTFDDLYLGSGSTFDTVYGRIVRPKLEAEFGGDLPLPLEHVFFISIDEFERLLARVRLGQCSIVGALRFAREQDAASQTKKFVFQQHLEALCRQTERLPLLEDGLNALVNRCLGRLNDPRRLR